MSELDAFADSLIAIATSYRTGQPRDQQLAAIAASDAFLGASHPGVLADRARRLAERAPGRIPVPYPRSFDALVRIFDGSTDLRGSTLYMISQLPEQGRVIAFLSGVASSVESSAVAAVRHLSMDVGAGGLAELRRLYSDDAVVQPTAKEHLHALASVHGWTSLNVERARS